MAKKVLQDMFSKALDSAKGAQQDKEEQKIVTRADISHDLYKELENEWYAGFDVMRLFASVEEKSNMMQFVVIGLLVVSIIVGFIR